MDATESAAIAATLDTKTLLRRIEDVMDCSIGDPLNVPADNKKLQDAFKLMVEATASSQPSNA